MVGPVRPEPQAADRLRGLLFAATALATQLDLSQLLREIVVSARDLVGATYAALGVLGEDAELTEFIHVGFDDATAAAIGPLPRGHGLLGVLIADPRPLRLPDLHTHEASVGFPTDHPPMRSFLGVPIRIGSSVFGNLYLTDKGDGGEFTAEDEELLVAMAAFAAVAIENARMVEEISRRNRWREASARVTAMLLSDADSSAALALVVSEARRLVDADDIRIVRRIPGADDTLEALASEGQIAQRLEQTRRSLPLAGTIAELVYRTGPTTSADAHVDQRLSNYHSLVPDIGPLLAVPMTNSEETVGVLIASRRRGRAPFNRIELVQLTYFGQQAALALELAQGRASAEQLRREKERERITHTTEGLAVIARLLETGSVHETLQQIVDLAVHSVPGCEQAGISLVHGRKLGNPAASHEVALRVDAAQFEVGEGPSLDAMSESVIFTVDDLVTDVRWPAFCARARTETGVVSLLAVQLFARERTLGALLLLSSRPAAFGEEARAVAAIFAPLAAAVVDAAQTEEGLQLALKNRDVIGQAKGILMERHKISDEEAFEQLRGASQRLNIRLSTLAERVLANYDVV